MCNQSFKRGIRELWASFYGKLELAKQTRLSRNPADLIVSSCDVIPFPFHDKWNSIIFWDLRWQTSNMCYLSALQLIWWENVFFVIFEPIMGSGALIAFIVWQHVNMIYGISWDLIYSVYNRSLIADQTRNDSLSNYNARSFIICVARFS